MLEVDRVSAGYGRGTILFDLSLAVRRGEVVALLGRNGMGKTTLGRAITGGVKLTSGEIRIDGRSIAGLKPYQIARCGLGLVPEGRLICGGLTVRENLAASAVRGAWTLEGIYDLFPRLRERADHAGGALSGGEQQMLAIGRALMTNPRLLLLDEATEGLAPVIRQQIWAVLARLKKGGLSILIVDRNLRALRSFADRFVVLSKGRVAWEGDAAAFDADTRTLETYLGV
ncbi:ABC transporter ATP-binding protein [Chelatococcus asaccharovorans]|nr:ABC transporter ATP-binding protein [Chelatococcus asaccharovorans]